MDDKTDMGPVANDRRLAAMQALVDDAVAKGAELRAGGHRIGNSGYFFAPTVLAHVPDTAMIMEEEPFGPIAILNPVTSLDEAIMQANKLPYGLAAYGFTHSAANADRMAEEVETGNLSINTLEASLPETPFGGVKWSGYDGDSRSGAGQVYRGCGRAAVFADVCTAGPDGSGCGPRAVALGRCSIAHHGPDAAILCAERGGCVDSGGAWHAGGGLCRRAGRMGFSHTNAGFNAVRLRLRSDAGGYDPDMHVRVGICF